MKAQLAPNGMLLLLIASTVAAGPGCTGQHLDFPSAGCPVTNCPAAKLVYRVVSGSVIYGPPGGTVATYPVIAAGTATIDACSASYDTQVSLPAPPQAGVSNLSVSCLPIANNLFVSIYGLDARMLAGGVQQLTASSFGSPSVSSSYVVCGVRPPPIVTIDVTRAEGSFDDYPRLVTPDFVRELTVHVEYDTTDPTVPAACFVGAPQIDVGFAATAADVIQLPSEFCRCAL